MRRRRLGMAMAMGLLGACASPGAAPAPGGVVAQAQVYGITLLRSHADDPSDLVRFIERNWFAMDEAARQAGLISSYELRTRPAPASGWNVAVIVGYPDPRGYEGVREAFEAIRARHTIVPVAGARSVRDLGIILRSSEARTAVLPE